MTAQTKKLIDLKPEDWLRLYVDAELKLLSKKFSIEFDNSDIESVCKLVAEKKLQEGVDVYYALRLLILYYRGDRCKVEEDLDIGLAYSVMHGLKLGQDVLVYLYSNFCEENGYNEEVAYIFKQSMNYTIPF